jgi:hypothetical protein
MSTSPADRPSTDLVPLTVPTVFVVDEVQELLAANPQAGRLLADIMRMGRKSGVDPETGEATRLFPWPQARTVEEFGR